MISQKGVTKVGKDRISHLETLNELDYDNIMNAWQKVLDKEKAAFSQAKDKKRNDVEIWAHAVK
jgi:hypothetical protein